jgi:DNA-binding transcriptional regulator WhiA
MRGYFRKTILNSDKELQAYVIGLALGDGNLSNPNGRAVRLRISCDTKYPFLIQKIIASLKNLLPQNKIGTVNKKDKNCTDISVYSNCLEKLLGWKARGGSKFNQKTSVPDWIKQNDGYKINCLRGLIETDGAVYNDRGYRMIIFTSIIPELANNFYEMTLSLGFHPHIYEIKQHHKQTLYHIRLSKNVDKFLELIKPEKK